MKKTRKMLSILLCFMLLLGLTTTVAFAESTSGTEEEKEPVTVVKTEYTGKGTPKNCEIWFSINETAGSDVEVNIGDEVCKVLFENREYTMPADQFNVTVHIQNNSLNSFVYKNNGMKLGTRKVNANEALFLTDFRGFDGNQIDLPRIASLAYTHPAMSELFEKPFRVELTDSDFELILTMYDKLEAKGYSGNDALSNYFLDYYKTKYDDQELTWDGLLQNHRDEIISDFSKSGPSGLLYLTEEQLKMTENTRFENYTYVLGPTGNKYQSQLKWPEEQLAALSYNLFYQDLLTVAFDDEKVDNKVGLRTRGVGDYMDLSSEAYTKANAYLATIGEDGELESGEEGTFNMVLTLEGRGTGNMYMGYDFDKLFALSLNFVKTTLDIPVTKVWNDSNNQDQLRLGEVKVQLYANGEAVEGKVLTLNEANQWKDTFTNLPRQIKDKETNTKTDIVYTVQEVPAEISGYTTSITGTAETGFTITNTHTVSGGGYIPTPTPDTKYPLTISKVVAGLDVIPADYAVTVTITSKTGAVQTLTLRANEQKTIELPQGEYVISEAAPSVDGYTLTGQNISENNFVLTTGGKSIVITNTYEKDADEPAVDPTPTKPEQPTKPEDKTEVPKTGDNSALAGSALLLLLSACGITAALRRKED